MTGNSKLAGSDAAEQGVGADKVRAGEEPRPLQLNPVFDGRDACEPVMGRKAPKLLTLSRAHFVYVAVICLVVLPILAGIVFSPVLMVLWCDHFEIPEYERSFGFRMETFQVPSSQGGSYLVRGIGRVDPGGLLSVAGVRAGDIPRQHHGTEFCGALAVASQGREASIDVVSLDDLRAGRYNRREITLRGSK